MSERDDHRRWRDDVAAYVLDALEPGEAAELERHLESCERCRDELRWLEPAARALPESAPRHDPPRGVRDRLMAEVRADARGADYAHATGLRRRLSAWLSSRRFGSLGLKPIVALGAVALIVVAFAGYEVGSGGSGSSAGTTITSRQPSGVDVKMSREGNVGTLSLTNVHQLPDDRVLEAWVRRRGVVEPVPALFVPNAEGRARTTIDDMRGVDTVMVTSEPRGGSKSPTTAPIVTLSVPQ